MIKKTLKYFVEKSPLLAGLYREFRDFFDFRSKSIATPWGFKLAGHADMALGLFEPTETKVIRDLLQEVEVLINIGANVGYYCSHALSFGKSVIAVEPLQRNLRYLMRNIKDNGWQEKIEIFPVALADSNNILDLFGGTTGASLVKGWAGCSKNYKTQVPILTLDRILGDNINSKKALIIVDIEGSELNMLHGAIKTLNNNPKPIWLVEICFNEHQPVGHTINANFRKVFEMFFEYNYKATAIADEPYEVTSEVLNSIINGDELLTTHNFLFRAN